LNKIFIFLFYIYFYFSLFADNNFNDIDSNDLNLFLQRMDEDNISFIRFLYLDISQDFKEILIPFSNARDVLQNGVKYLNGRLIPDLSTFRIIPWFEDGKKTAIFISSFYNGEYNDPRLILKNQINKLSDNFSVNFIASCSLEFMLLDNGKLTDDNSYADVEYSYNKDQEKKFIIEILENLNINVGKILHGKSKGQLKLSLKFKDVLELADNIVLTKYILKILAEQLNLKITFIPKLLSGQHGNNLGINFSLIDINSEKNIVKSYDEFNSIVDNFVVGIITYVYDFFNIYVSSINSYRRINAELLNKKILKIKDSEIKFKLADCQTNPYLLFAALICSGIKGIEDELSKNNLDKFFLINKRLYLLDREYYINFMLNSNIAKKLLGESLNNIIYKNELTKLEEFKNSITDWEIFSYFNKF